MGIKHTCVESSVVLTPGHHQVRIEFKYEGGGLGKGGQVALFVDGKKTGEGAIPADRRDDRAAMARQ